MCVIFNNVKRLLRMERLLVKNFGPVSGGLDTNNGYLEIYPVTVFCGNQATGKSTIAKLYSSFIWLEKAFTRGDFERKTFSKDTFLTICNNQRIGRYFKKDTILEYRGESFNFSYRDGEFSAEENSGRTEEYERPKVMYVPSERNLLTVLEDADSIKGLPPMLSLFLDRYNSARRKMNGDVYHLPVSGVSIKYDKDALETVVLTDSNMLPISEASSGIQSVTPLSIVTKYLSDDISSGFDSKVQRLSIKERDAIIEDIEKKYSKDHGKASYITSELVTYFNTGILKSDEDKIEKLLKHYFNSRFINIVEEPEQNLYPESQRLVLYELLKYLNQNKRNKLIMTTHSPYIISYLILAAKAAELKDMGISNGKIEKIVPVDSICNGNGIAVYETKEDGSIKKLESRYGLPSDDNVLNLALSQTNDDFSDLLEAEAALGKN